jgi:HK97 family phage prohead protease
VFDLVTDGLLDIECRGLPDGQYRFVASTETKDSYDRVLLASGWALEKFRTNPVMLWNHGHSSMLEDLPIGAVPEVGIKSKRLMATVERLEIGRDSRVDRLWDLVDSKHLRAVSIGARPLKAPTYEFDEHDNLVQITYASQELNELSLVSVPANADALRVAASLFDGTSDSYRRVTPTPDAHRKPIPTPRNDDRLQWLARQRGTSSSRG